MLAIGFSTFKTIVSRGDLKVARINRRVVVPIDELRKYLAEKIQ